jgi:hypothetical protein
MELYLEDWDMMRGALHWDVPPGVEDPSSRARPHGAHRPVGELITIAPSTPEELAQVERRCDTPEQVVDVIGEFSGLTLVFINCHSIDDQGRSDANERGTVSGILLGGARIYARHLPLFRRIRSSFTLRWTEPSTLGLVHSAHAYVPASSGTPTGRSLVSFGPLSASSSSPIDIDQPFRDDAPSPAPATSPAPVEYTITAAGFNQNSHLFVPRIVMRSCSIGQNRDFCQRLADAADTWVFAPTVDQWASQTRWTPWELHGPVRVFVPASMAHLPVYGSRQDLSPFNRRLGQQRIATGSGRGIGRRRGPIGLA